MKYNFKRALGLSLLTYIATFIIGILAGIISGQDMSSMSTVSSSFWYVGMVAAVILTFVFTNWYFKNPNIAPSATTGFYFGFTVVVVSFILDFIFFTIGNSQGANVDLGQYYGDYRFWIILLLVIATAKVVGFSKLKKAF